ncbi:putative metalloprotease CJM1_0395 family protein [Persephonella sp.]|uniref:putative metalloprotease CJM1_0395 family protein n=1 Tax=Persephonella sp. TaxID=2060922 RepID=UPI0025EF089F|nr:putative metalloprotease CJM1_0395 family protein [Persephonella sp.]
MIGKISEVSTYHQVSNYKNDLKKQQIIQKLRMIEQKVKAHEMAHKTAGGELTGPVHYKYQKGPDGRLYIVGGEVPIKIKVGKTPEETIEIARKIKRAALAPADPSPQDRAVAARTAILEMKARMELSKQQSENQPKISIYV